MGICKVFFYFKSDITFVHIGLLLLRLLNDNLLEGQVPEELYSIGVRGGAIEYVVQFYILLCIAHLTLLMSPHLFFLNHATPICSLSTNKGLCGVPSLPNCSLLWGKHGLSTGAKVAIGLSCLVIFSALLFGIYYCVIRRRRNDYDFGLPHELMCKFISWYS